MNKDKDTKIQRLINSINLAYMVKLIEELGEGPGSAVNQDDRPALNFEDDPIYIEEEREECNGCKYSNGCNREMGCMLV